MNEFSWCKSQEIADVAIRMLAVVDPKHDVSSLWKVWQETMETVYPLVAPYLNDPITVAVILHTWARRRSKYAKEGANFFQFLVNAENGCNCNCGSMFLLAVLECLGLFPSGYFAAAVDHGHIYLTVDRTGTGSQHEIFETTVDRPFVCQYVPKEKQMAFYTGGVQYVASMPQIVTTMLEHFLSYVSEANHQEAAEVIQYVLTRYNFSPSTIRAIVAYTPRLMSGFSLSDFTALLVAPVPPNMRDFSTYVSLIGSYIQMYDASDSQDIESAQKVLSTLTKVMKQMKPLSTTAKTKKIFAGAEVWLSTLNIMVTDEEEEEN